MEPLMAFQSLRLYLQRPQGPSQRLGEVGCEHRAPLGVAVRTNKGRLLSTNSARDLGLLQHLTQISALIKAGWGCKRGQ